MNKNLKKLIGLGLIGGLIAAMAGTYIYQSTMLSNVHKKGTIYIKTGSSYQEVMAQLEPLLINKDEFQTLSEYKEYPKFIKAGRFVIPKGMSNRTLINKLKGGIQDEVRVTIKSYATLPMAIGKIAKKLELDSSALIKSFKDPSFLKEQNIDFNGTKKFLTANTYHYWWNVSADEFRDKMVKEYHTFWNDKRENKAEKLKLSKQEVIALASIVMRETVKNDEQPKVAGLYLNRLRQGIKLQSDPTALYALKLKIGFDTIIQRVLNKHLRIQSPYNTYTNTGLPPTGICIVTPQSVDAVLDADSHEYIFMCADPDNRGYHRFTKSYQEHLANAKDYQRWLTEYLRKRKIQLKEEKRIKDSIQKSKK